MHGKICVLFFGLAVITALAFSPQNLPADNKNILSYVVNPQKQHLALYWQNDSARTFKSIAALKNWLNSKKQKLIFAMNGGMYQTDNRPLGLFINHGKTIKALNTAQGTGNFYMAPNGVLYITKSKQASICQTKEFKNTPQVDYATQSGPMLVFNGQINRAFKAGSTNLNIRNGVGILPGNRLLFAMSKEPVNFYDFALYFKTCGCKNALYLDGFVSRTYLPEKQWEQTDGNFGVIIAVTEP